MMASNKYFSLIIIHWFSAKEVGIINFYIFSYEVNGRRRSLIEYKKVDNIHFLKILYLRNFWSWKMR